MTDRSASSEAFRPPQRYRSPHAEALQYHYDSLNNTPDLHPASTSQKRRHPSRTNSSTQVSQRPETLSTQNSSDGRSKARNTLKKLPRRDSHIESAYTLQAGQAELDERADTLGFMPELSQIKGGKVSTRSSSRSSSGAGSRSETRALRRRHTDDDAVSRSRAGRKQGSLQRRADNFTTLSNPSLTSITSGVTQQSGTSAETNSTVTQQSYDDHKHIAQPAPPRRRRTKMDRNKNTPSPTETDASQPGVFQFLQEESVQSKPPYTASSSSEDSTSSDEGQSSNVGEPQQMTDSPTTSPASTRRSNSDFPQFQSHDFPHLKKPLYASSFVHGHGEEGEHDEGEEEDEEASSNDGEEEAEEEDSETESDEERDEISVITVDTGHASDRASHKHVPPRVASSASHHSDSRARRLKQQEQELANHILQSPQPQKDFQFGAAQSTNVYAPMPLYSPRAYSGVSPASPQATAAPMYAWPQMPSFPAPLPIGNSPHQSPEAKKAFPLTVQPPMGAPVPSAQQYYPPFSPHSVQPPVYQPHVAPPRTTVAGYELLADKLSEPAVGGSKSTQRKTIVPLYRKFEHLNHRVLLHLQDEISELEEELRQLDECIVQISPRDESGEAYPASRRGDARYGGEVHFKRTELLGRIFQKLGQYNQALTSFNDLVKNLDPANAEDVQAYRAWMDEHDAIDEAETMFLERQKDLVAVSRKTSVSTVRGAAPHQSAAMWFPLMLILPLMAFAIVPNLLGRLFVIALIGAAELKLITSTPELLDFMKVQEWTMAASVYFGVMALLAGFVR